MELYTLDSSIRRISVTDRFESLIWTERYAAFGDFELVIHSNNQNRSLFTAGTLLAVNESCRVMTVENIEDDHDSTGKSILKVTGRSIEATLEDRVATDAFQGSVLNPSWRIIDKPGAIARLIFKRICMDGILSMGDIIPFIYPGSMFPANTIPEPSEIITVDLEVSTVYEAIKKICDTYGLGFRLVRKLDTSQIYFDIYSGDNRTSTQNDVTPVLFSPDLDNMSGVKSLSSIAQYKNVAYVFSKNGAEKVYSLPIGEYVGGFARKVLLVKADDIDDAAGPALTALLIKRGKDALAQSIATSAIDGEVSQYSPYKYGVDYNLGDLVEMRNSDGVINNMRVTEQIFVSDTSSGDRSYPTLTMDLMNTPGSWAAWDPNEHWPDSVPVWQDA